MLITLTLRVDHSFYLSKQKTAHGVYGDGRVCSSSDKNGEGSSSLDRMWRFELRTQLDFNNHGESCRRSLSAQKPGKTYH